MGTLLYSKRQQRKPPIIPKGPSDRHPRRGGGLRRCHVDRGCSILAPGRVGMRSTIACARRVGSRAAAAGLGAGPEAQEVSEVGQGVDGPCARRRSRSTTAGAADAASPAVIGKFPVRVRVDEHPDGRDAGQRRVRRADQGAQGASDDFRHSAARAIGPQPHPTCVTVKRVSFPTDISDEGCVTL